MEPIVLTQDKWSHSLHVPVYLFFGGLTAGTFIVAVVADLVGNVSARWRTLSRLAALAAVPMLALAGFFLTAHLGKPERGMIFPLFFTNYNSWMTRGGWIVVAVAPVVILYAALWWFRATPRVRQIVGCLGVPLAAGFAMYTGALLAGAMFVPLWSMKHLPILFLNSGLTTGVAAAGLLFALAWPFVGGAEDSERPILRWLGVALIVFIALELLEISLFLRYLAAAGPATDVAVVTPELVGPMGRRLAYEYVTAGGLAPYFWWGIIGLGLVVPLALTVPEFIVRGWTRQIAGVKFALVLVGGFMLRWVIVHGGDLKAPLPFPPSKWPIPGFGG